MPDDDTFAITLQLPGPEATDRLGAWFSDKVGPGDVFLLSGPVGAGKSHFARALIKECLARSGVDEDVPSPTFTLIQTYVTSAFEIVHADLYRLGSALEVVELGLDGLESCVSLIEWPDRLGASAPQDGLNLTFTDTEGGLSRQLQLSGRRDRWQHRLQQLAVEWRAQT